VAGAGRAGAARNVATSNIAPLMTVTISNLCMSFDIGLSSKAMAAYCNVKQVAS